MAQGKIVNVYGINLTDEERKQYAKREKTTYLEFVIPVTLEEKLSGIIEKELKEYFKIKQNKKWKI